MPATIHKQSVINHYRVKHKQMKNQYLVCFCSTDSHYSPDSLGNGLFCYDHKLPNMAAVLQVTGIYQDDEYLYCACANREASNTHVPPQNSTE